MGMIPCHAVFDGAFVGSGMCVFGSSVAVAGVVMIVISTGACKSKAADRSRHKDGTNDKCENCWFHVSTQNKTRFQPYLT